jgi:hypothetical protein
MSWPKFYKEMRKMTAEVDEMIRQAEEIHNHINVTTESTGSSKSVIYRIKATPWSARRKLFWTFWRCAWGILFKGSASFKITAKGTSDSGTWYKGAHTGRWSSTEQNRSNPPQ